MLALAVVFFTACSEDLIVVVKQTNATINLLNPSESVDITSFEGAIITFTELNTKTTTSKRIDNNVIELTLNQGSYEVSINGGVKYSLNGEEQEGNIGAFVSELNSLLFLTFFCCSLYFFIKVLASSIKFFLSLI